MCIVGASRSQLLKGHLGGRAVVSDGNNGHTKGWRQLNWEISMKTFCCENNDDGVAI